MLDLLKYAEEPQPFITRDSIMNFEVGGKVIYMDQECEILRVAGKMIRIDLGTRQDYIDYQQLKVVSLGHKEPENIGKPWNQKDIRFLLSNYDLPNSNLSKLLGRTEQGIANKKTQIKDQIKF